MESLTKGLTSIDEATITGESMPRSKGEGDEVFASTVNLSNRGQMRGLQKVRILSLRKL